MSDFEKYMEDPDFKAAFAKESERVKADERLAKQRDAYRQLARDAISEVESWYYVEDVDDVARKAQVCAICGESSGEHLNECLVAELRTRLNELERNGDDKRIQGW